MIEVARLIVDLGQLAILIRVVVLFRVYFGPGDSHDHEEAATPSNLLEDL